MTKKFSLFVALLMSVSVWATELQQVRIYQRANGGFVAVDAAGEIVGFSSTARFSEVPESMQSLLQVQGMQAQVTYEPLPQAVAEALNDLVIKDSVGPIMDVHFNQSKPYNLHLPTVGDNHCVTGCVATAMVQVMVYHHHPLQCKGGTKTYKTADLSLTMNYDYDKYAPDWDNILTDYGNGVSYTDAQADAIAELMKAAGISVEMNYNVDGSGTNTEKAADALRTYFDFDRDLEYVDKSGVESEFHNMMQAEIKANRPMICSSRPTSGGTGHAYVCDGFLTYEGLEEFPKQTLYHFNWGWGGSDDGWFRLNNMKPSFQDLTGSFSVIKGIRPAGSTDLKTVRLEKDMVIYDILGRVVEFTQPGQMYIRGGKKFIAK